MGAVLTPFNAVPECIEEHMYVCTYVTYIKTAGFEPVFSCVVVNNGALWGSLKIINFMLRLYEECFLSLKKSKAILVTGRG
jgi:hypothetical protein